MLTTSDVLIGISDGDWVGFGEKDGINRVAVVGRCGTQRGEMLSWMYREWQRVLGGGGIFLDTFGEVAGGDVPGAGVIDVDGGSLAKLVFGLDGFDDGLREEGVAGVLQAVRAGVDSWSVPAEQALELALRAGVVYNRRVGADAPKVWAKDCVDLLLGWPAEGCNSAMLEVLAGSALENRLKSLWFFGDGAWREAVRKCYGLMGDCTGEGVDPEDLKRPLRDGGSLVVNASYGISGETGISGLGSIPVVLGSAETRGKQVLMGLDLRSGVLPGGFGNDYRVHGAFLAGVSDWDEGVDLGSMDIVVDLDAVPGELSEKCRRMGIKESDVAPFVDGSALAMWKQGVAYWMHPVDRNGWVYLG